jgi:LacI family transcriptional regulator
MALNARAPFLRLAPRIVALCSPHLARYAEWNECAAYSCGNVLPTGYMSSRRPRQGPTPVTLADLASACSVSAASASRALGRPDRVSEALRAKVHAAAVHLGYRVRQPALTQETDARAVAIVCDGHLSPWARIADALGEALESEGLETVRLVSGKPARTWLRLDGMARIALIGLRPPDTLVARAAAGTLRLATVGDHPASGAVVCEVRYAPRASLAAALAALRGLRHRHIGRWRARVAAMLDAGRGLDRHAGDLRRWLEAGSLTALICDDAPTAVEAVLAACDSGIRVPEELSIVALEDHPILRAVSPSVTAFSEPIGEIVRALAHGLISGEARTAPMPMFKVRVAVRASAAPPGTRFT